MSEPKPIIDTPETIGIRRARKRAKKKPQPIPLMFFRGRPEDYEKAGVWERKVVAELLEIMIQRAPDIREGLAVDLPSQKSWSQEHPLDIEFFYKDGLLAYVDVSYHDHLYYGKHPHILVDSYKIKIPQPSMPVFIVEALPSDERCQRYWTAREKIKSCLLKPMKRWIVHLHRYVEEEPYAVPWKFWNRGLESLADELIRTIRACAQKMSSSTIRSSE